MTAAVTHPPRRIASVAARSLARVWGILLALFLTASPAAAESLEYSVKANYLVRFAAFVQWPPEAFPTPTSALAICVLGADPFGADLTNAAAGQMINGRAIIVRKLARVDARSACNILYVGRGGEQTVREVSDILERRPVLIVTDEARGAERGHLHFVVAGNRVRFHIDDAAAKQSGLTISSRLLSLAVTVKAAA